MLRAHHFSKGLAGGLHSKWSAGLGSLVTIEHS